jgi:hypothetical protein
MRNYVAKYAKAVVQVDTVEKRSIVEWLNIGKKRGRTVGKGLLKQVYLCSTVHLLFIFCLFLWHFSLSYRPIAQKNFPARKWSLKFFASLYTYTIIYYDNEYTYG